MAITRVGGAWAHEYVSLAADDITNTLTKAAKPDLKIPNGSTCLEMDTSRVFAYDADGDQWYELGV